MKFNLISTTTRRAQTDLLACKTELERLLLIRRSGKPRANHCIDFDTLDTFYAPQIGKYRVYPSEEKESYQFKTPEEAMAVSRQMNEYLSNRIEELTSKL